MVDLPIPASPEMTKTPPKGPGDDSLLPGEPPSKSPIISPSRPSSLFECAALPRH